MARHSSRLSRLVRWQYIRWGLAFPTFTLALWACNAHDLQQPKPNPQQETDFKILVTPERAVDILFVIDNSPSMDPKQQALARNFPEMIKALEQLEGGLPDVRVGVVSSDVGAGGGEAGGNCSVVLGNMGKLWGNDPTVPPPSEATSFYNEFATVSHLKAGDKEGCGMNSGTRWIEDTQNDDGVTRTRNYEGSLADVFSCLAKGVGTRGCGYEHPLQSVRVALNPAKEINPQNMDFLRRKAYLAVVLIADEDDCSADPTSDTNGGMFWPRTLGDTSSLRCATRGHVCKDKDGNLKPIPDYDPGVGYSGSGFKANFADCEAKDIVRKPPPEGSKELDPTYEELPLIRVRDMIDHVKQVKDRPAEQILVSGIIGWPEGGKLDSVEYRIGKDETSKEQKNLWDYMPICSVPSETSADGEIYKAYGGYRLKKFIDGFNENGQGVFSLCSTDNFKDAMKQIGDAIVRKLKPGCVAYPLIDRDPNIEQVQPECQVIDQKICDTPGQKGTGCLLSGYQEDRLSECKDPNGNTVNPTWSLEQIRAAIPDDEAHRPCWYLIYDGNKNSGCPDAFNNQKITALRPGNGNAPPGTYLDMKCLTCALPTTETGESSCPALGTM